MLLPGLLSDQHLSTSVSVRFHTFKRFSSVSLPLISYLHTIPQGGQVMSRNRTETGRRDVTTCLHYFVQTTGPVCIPSSPGWGNVITTFVLLPPGRPRNLLTCLVSAKKDNGGLIAGCLLSNETPRGRGGKKKREDCTCPTGDIPHDLKNRGS